MANFLAKHVIPHLRFARLDRQQGCFRRRHHWTGNFAMGLFRLLGEILMKPIRLAPLTLLMSCCLVWTAQALELRVFEWEGYISPYKAELGQNWQFTKLKEGETVWLDNVSIAKAVEKDPAKLEAAYLLVDFLISAKVQAEIVKDMGVVAVNPKAGPLPPAGSPAAELAGDATFFKEERFWQPLSSRTRNAYRQMWDEALKAAGK
jgi:spermidine/putrescine-binding protein